MESPYFQIEEEPNGGYYTALFGHDGKLILKSQVFPDKSQCITAINLIRRISQTATIVDLSKHLQQ